MYEYLSLKIAESEEVLTLATYAPTTQPIPNLLFGAVHYLLLSGKKHELSDFYPSLVANPGNAHKSFSAFEHFCVVFKQEIIALLKTKLVQTNEVRRCAYLYPCFSYIYNECKQPLALIEIGTSAGLQLLWDQYTYSYSTGTFYGATRSDVHIVSTVTSYKKPFLLRKSPPVMERIGIDLHVNDLSNDEDYLWLKALIWPENKERVELFEKAVAVARQHEFTLIQGDGIALLPETAAKIPSGRALTIFHTHVANQFTDEAKCELVTNIKRLSEQRPIYHIYNNMWDAKLHLDTYVNGKCTPRTIAKTDGHARSFSWYL